MRRSWVRILPVLLFVAVVVGNRSAVALAVIAALIGIGGGGIYVLRHGGLSGLSLPTASDGAADAQQEQSRREIERGGLPVNAQRRLRELTGPERGLFTSDLSVDEFALLHREGITPITQVMGSSIFQHGWQNLPRDTWYSYRQNRVPMGGGSWSLTSGSNWGPGGDGSAWHHELTTISDAFNGARERALNRLRLEAELAGADAVVGVRLNTQGHDFVGGDNIEFTAVGTAVRLPAALRTDQPVITDLTGQDYVLLAREGCRPVGVVGVSTVMYIASGYGQSWVLQSGNAFWSNAGRANQELSDFTRGFYDTREVAMGHLNRQAARLGAHGIVGVSLHQHLREREYDDVNENSHHDLVVYLHLLGTAITEGHEPLAHPELITVLPVNRSAS